MNLTQLKRTYIGIFILFLAGYITSCSVVEKAKSFVGLQPQTTVLFDGSDLEGWARTDFAGKGEITINEKKHLVMEMGAELTGLHWQGEALPTVNYEINIEARRTMGSDFFCGLTFPYKESHATLVIGGWGGSLIGISSIDDFDASENDTGDAFIFDENRWYQIKLRVTDQKFMVWIDNELVINCDLEGRKIGMRSGEIEMSKPLGITTYATTGEFKRIDLVRIQ